MAPTDDDSKPRKVSRNFIMIRLRSSGIFLALVVSLSSSTQALALNDLWTENLGEQGISIKRAETCSQFDLELESFKDWQQSLGPSDEFSPDSVYELTSEVSENGQVQCKAIGKNILPLNLENLFKKAPARNGPNCWNTALYSKNLLRSIRFTSADEFNFWLNSPYCRPLQENEANLPGDIIAIRTYEFDPVLNKYTSEISEVHGFTNVSELLSFSKDTSRKDDLYDLATKADVFARFRLDKKECQQIIGEDKGCSIWANYFRCQNISHEQVKANITATFGEAFSEELIAIEKKIEEDNLGVKPLTKSQFEIVKASLEALKEELKMSPEPTIDNIGFVKKSLMLEIESLLIGISYGQK